MGVAVSEGWERSAVLLVLGWTALSDLLSMFNASFALSVLEHADLFLLLGLRACWALASIALVLRGQRAGWWSAAVLCAWAGPGLLAWHLTHNLQELRPLTALAQGAVVVLVLLRARG